MRSTRRHEPGRLVCWVCAVAVLAMFAGAAGQVPKDKPGGEGNQPAAGTVKMTRPGTFKISVRGADLRGVLQLLSIQGQKNIVATKEVTGTVTADLYDVTFDEALEAVLQATGFVHRKKGKFIYVYTSDQLAKILDSERTMSVRTFKLYYITATDAKTLLTPAMSDKGTMAVAPTAAIGIAESSSDTGGNAYAVSDVIVVRDYEDNLKKVADLLREIDVRPEQVLIEATILRAKITEKNALGVDFTVLAGIDFEGINSTSAGLSSVTPGSMTGTDLNVRASKFSTDFASTVPTGGMTIGLITNELAMFIRALESVTDVTVLANPKLLVVNKQRGEVMVGNRDGYLTTTFTETTATQTVEFLETGTRLLFRPFIGKDGFIRLEIHPEDSSGAVVQVGGSALPSETTTEVTTNVIVRDGRTIIIGGLFREITTAGRAQIPGIGNIPYLGAMFRNTVDDTVREEVIILITPRIIKHANDEGVSEQAKNDVTRIRIGARKGLRWWGRSRLAQAALRKAKRALAAGDRSKALWYTDKTLSLDPRMLEAIQLKERLTETAYWSDEYVNGASRFIVKKMIMQELGLPVSRIISPRRPLDVDKIDPAVRKTMGIQKRPVDPLFRPRMLKVVPAGKAPKKAPPKTDGPKPAAAK